MLLAGETTTVSNIKGDGSIEDKIVKITKVNLPKNVKAKVTLVYDLRMTIKDKGVKFDLGQAFFDSIPDLSNKGTGLTQIFANDKLFLQVCTDGVENDLKNKPLYMSTLKGAAKSLSFKSQALEFYTKKIKTINLEEDGQHLFSLVATPRPDVFQVVESVNQLEIEETTVSEKVITSDEPAVVNTVAVDPAQLNLIDQIEELAPVSTPVSFTDDSLDEEEKDTKVEVEITNEVVDLENMW